MKKKGVFSFIDLNQINLTDSIQCWLEVVEFRFGTTLYDKK